MNYRNLNNCVACDSTSLKPILDLGQQPLANSFLTDPQQHEVTYPLQLNICTDCGHLQLSIAVNPQLLFNEYIYRSGTTRTLREYFDTFARHMTERHKPGRVLDVASNDGSQLDAFARYGWATAGVDPAANLATFNKHMNHVGFFDDSCEYLGTFDVIVAQNVLAHTANPLGLLQTARRMAPIMYVQTSQAHMLERGEFDTIYHEHISFFSPHSMIRLANRAGWAVTGVFTDTIHGGSYIFQLTRDAANVSDYEPVSMKNAQWFAQQAQFIINDLREYIPQSERLIGYGAAAKGMTVLNAVGVGPEYIIDDAPEKQGMYTPGLRIPVVGPEVLLDEVGPLDVMPLAWNFHDEIVARITALYGQPFRSLATFPHVEWC